MPHPPKRKTWTIAPRIALLYIVALLWSVHAAYAQPEAVHAIQRLNGVATQLPEGGWEVEFQLRGQALADVDLEVVTRLGSIVSLNLRDTQVTSAGLVHLDKLKKLKRLHLERTRINDDGIQHLSNLHNLEYLNLYGTKVSDAALKHLTGLHRLSKLFVWQTRVTQAGADKLKKANPELDVSLGVNLSTIITADIQEKERKPKNLAQLEWLPEGGDKKPPGRSYTGSFIMLHFENKRAKNIKLYWISYNGKETYYADIPAGGQREQTSYSRAVWMITDPAGNRLGYFVTNQDSSTAIIPRG